MISMNIYGRKPSLPLAIWFGWTALAIVEPCDALNSRYLNGMICNELGVSFLGLTAA